MTKHKLMANAIRVLAMDAVEKASSGHPGAPMGMADIATVLWRKHLRVNPADPKWHNRDRFVLSNGHGSMLQYALLHLTGFDVTLEDIKAFRQLHSKTPGHPEVDETPGVETTTGPLGQGIANAVGFALAEAHLAARFNKENLTLVDHYTYCFLGDGCLMEGVSHEACSFAGTLGLGKLIAIYDSNNISIDGEIEPWYSENVAKRFEAYGWQVIDGVDGHDEQAINEAITVAKNNQKQPTLIICKTIIGYGAPNLAGSEKSHGSPLGAKEISAFKQAFDLPDEPFAIPDEVYKVADLSEKGSLAQDEWDSIWSEYETRYPEQAKLYRRVMSGTLPTELDAVVEKALEQLNEEAEKMATRKASQQALDILAPYLPEFVGGSADLTGSNNTNHKGSQAIKPHDFVGNYIHYGVREFAMAAIMNAMYLHGGIRPYGGTFLVFSDYMRNAMRLSALMKLPVVYVLTHDSIGLGEDGPTHQPIEQVASLRLIPNLNVWRPCDTSETLVAWYASLNDSTPTALALSRQGLPAYTRDAKTRENIARGGYVLQAQENPDVVLIATGSEVELVMQAAEQLSKEEIKARVVSMPCVEIFLEQELSYRQAVLGENLPTLAVEAGVEDYWYKIVGAKGSVLGINTFGASAPAEDLFKYFGLTLENVLDKVRGLLNQ